MGPLLEIRGHFLVAKVWTVFKNLTDPRSGIKYIVDVQPNSPEVAKRLFRAAQLAVDLGEDQIYVTFPLEGLSEEPLYDQQRFEAYLKFEVRPDPTGDPVPEIRGPLEMGSYNLNRVSSINHQLKVEVEVPIIKSLVTYQMFTAFVDLVYKDGR